MPDLLASLMDGEAERIIDEEFADLAFQLDDINLSLAWPYSTSTLRVRGVKFFNIIEMFNNIVFFNSY